jgi:hypothetical protein
MKGRKLSQLDNSDTFGQADIANTGLNFSRQ